MSADGQGDASPDLEAEAGEAVAIVLENEAAVGYELRLLDPDGGDVFAVEASSEDREDGRALFREVGTHVVEVHPIDRPEGAEEFEVEVSDT